MAIQMDGGRYGIDIDAWRELAKRGAAPGDVVIRKQYVADEVKEIEGENRTLGFTISTGGVDRDRDTIAPEGWKLDSFLKNPVVLWAHDYRGLPVARAVSVTTGDGKLSAKAQFADHPFAETVFQMLKGGFLRATSVGFRPIKHVYNDERRGMDFSEQELLEFSIVPVPANPEALMEAAAKGIDVRPVVSWAKDVLASAVKERKGIAKDEHGPEDCPMGEQCPMRGKAGPSDYLKALLAASKQDGFEVQTVIFPKAHWDLDGAKTWASDHDFRTDKVDETDESFRFRQRDPVDFERLRTICINPGDAQPDSDSCKVKAVGGPLKAAEPEEKVLLLSEEDVERYVVDPKIILEAWAEVIGGKVASAIGALRGRVD